MSRVKRYQTQLTLDDARRPTGRGGWRPGAGRPKRRSKTAHVTREDFASRYPVHVTWRVVDGAPSLRTHYPGTIIRESISRSGKSAFGVVEYSVQSNHLHMIVEANGKRALELGMRGLARRIRAGLARELGWKGPLFTRYDARILETPREVRNALRYVLLNKRHHALERGELMSEDFVDRYSSSLWFDGWSTDLVLIDAADRALAASPRPTARPRTWLLATGWKRWGLLAIDDDPGTSRSKARLVRTPRAHPLPFAVTCEQDLIEYFEELEAKDQQALRKRPKSKS